VPNNKSLQSVTLESLDPELWWFDTPSDSSSSTFSGKSKNIHHATTQKDKMNIPVVTKCCFKLRSDEKLLLLYQNYLTILCHRHEDLHHHLFHSHLLYCDSCSVEELEADDGVPL